MDRNNEETEKQKLLQEHIDRLNASFWPLKLFGFVRFDISRGKIVKKSKFAIVMTLFLIFNLHCYTYYIIYELYIRTDYLFLSETLILLNFLLFQTFVSLNSSFVNRSNIANFLNTSIELDIFLGAKETMFMRDVTSNTYLILSAMVGFSEVIILIILFFTYVVELSVYVTGGLLFLLLYFIYYDLSFFVSLYTTLPLRVRYLNVAIMKLANMNQEYLPKQFPFNSILWQDNFDDMVDFHLRATEEDFRKALIMIFNLLRRLENAYRFTIFMCLTYIASGMFIVVQGWITWAKNPSVDIFRTLVVTGWGIVSWALQIGITQQIDMFQRQINQTSLICTYIQLKPTYPDEIYKLTASVLRVLEVRDPRISIYDIFYLDTGLLLRMISSIFVFITMQLQIAFPKGGDVNIPINGTDSNL